MQWGKALIAFALGILLADYFKQLLLILSNEIT